MQLATNYNIVHICDLVQQNCNIIDPPPLRGTPLLFYYERDNSQKKYPDNKLLQEYGKLWRVV